MLLRRVIECLAFYPESGGKGTCDGESLLVW